MFSLCSPFVGGGGGYLLRSGWGGTYLPGGGGYLLSGLYRGGGGTYSGLGGGGGGYLLRSGWGRGTYLGRGRGYLPRVGTPHLG